MAREELSADVSAPLTISIDVDTLLRRTGWAGVDQTDEEDWEPVGKLGEVVAQAIARQLAPKLQEAVTKKVKAIAEAKVDDIIDEVINGQIQLTNSYGERTGATTTLREQIIKSINDQLSRKVSRNGSNVSGFDRDGMPYVQWVAQQAAGQAISGELKPAMEEAVREAKARIAGLVQTALADQVVKAVTR